MEQHVVSDGKLDIFPSGVVCSGLMELRFFEGPPGFLECQPELGEWLRQSLEIRSAQLRAQG